MYNNLSKNYFSGENWNEENISTQKETEKQGTRIQKKSEDAGRKKDPEEKKR